MAATTPDTMVAPSKKPSWRERYSDGSGPGQKPHMGLRILAGAVVFVVFILPYLYMVTSSLKPKKEATSVDPHFFPQHWQFENYQTMWTTPETPVFDNLISTLVISISATLLVLVVAMPAAYYTARFRFPGRGVFLFCVLLTQMLQPAVLVAGLMREFVAIALQDTWMAMILVNSAFNLSFATWIMHSFFASVPKEIDDAAQIDGAGRWTVLTKVNLPLVWPGIVTAVIFTFVAAWNEFAASLVILSSAEKQPLSVALTKFIGQYDTSWQYVFGVSVVAIIPVVILFACIEKRLVAGLTTGSIK